MFCKFRKHTSPHLQLTCINWFVLNEQGSHLLKDLVFKHCSQLLMGYKTTPPQSRESTFDCYRLHLFMRHEPLRKVFFLSLPWSWLTLSECLLEILPLPKCMQYYNMNLVFIQRTSHIYFLGMCGWGPASETQGTLLM